MKPSDWSLERPGAELPLQCSSRDGCCLIEVYRGIRLDLATFPSATVTRLEDAGHYLQEDAFERIVPELVAFVAALDR